ncbi:O-acyltransferase like protein-like isoform X1 [Anopheles merus]|uniref:O-acyltransferase like protein-like isoform X1 n=2 Tax=Anopheles merus TaxID=30066 RepID=UPI001BE43A3A|nr:O-acyltransferase like protein-like isoform X1 [Anopheles merus]
MFTLKYGSITSILLVLFLIEAYCSVSFANQVELMQIYRYDDYEECRRTYSDFVYCNAISQIVPAFDSKIWTRIQEYSTHPRHFDRSAIETGTCLQKCRHTMQSVEHNITAELHDCVKTKIWSQYELNSSINILNCITAEELNDTSETSGVARLAFLCISIGIIMLVIFATVYDGVNTNDPTKTRSLATTKLIQSFSISRNLSKLIDRETKSGMNLRHLDGIRALTMIIILLTHSSIPLIKMPLKNANDLEAQFNQPWFPIAMAGNTYTVQLFFVIGGLLLAVNILEQTKNCNRIGVAYFFERVKIRLIRILPLYLFVILFHASWYPRMKEGLIGNRFRDYCTTNWWTNLFFINNYINPSEPCIQFSWYLGADFQLYLLGTILMLLMRIPRLFKPIVICMTITAFVVPIGIIYRYHLDATVMMILRHVLQEIRTLPYYLHVYIPSETNAGNYFFGMLAGITYYRLKDNPNAKSILKLNFILPASALMFILLNSLTIMLPSDHINQPSLSLAIYGSLLKSAWGIFPSVLLVYMAFQEKHSLLVNFLQHPILLVGSKLSYSIYLVQYGIIYAVYKHITYPIVYESFTIILFTAAIVNITFCVAFMLHIFIELPFNLFLKQITRNETAKK